MDFKCEGLAGEQGPRLGPKFSGRRDLPEHSVFPPKLCTNARRMSQDGF